MSAMWQVLLTVGGLAAFVAFAWLRPKAAARVIQVVITGGFCGFALYGLWMTVFGNGSKIGGVLFALVCAGLAFAAYNGFGRMIQARFGD